MSFIECPSCQKTVEITGGDSGFYDCPYCDEEFEFNAKIVHPDSGPAIVLGVFFLVFFGALILMISQMSEDNDWKETQGKIVGGGNSLEYDISYDYTFMVEGVSFDGTDGCSNEGGTSNCGGYEIGDSVMISYNPENPNQNEMVDNQPGMMLFCCFIPVVAILGYGFIGALRGEITFKEEPDNPS